MSCPKCKASLGTRIGESHEGWVGEVHCQICGYSKPMVYQDHSLGVFTPDDGAKLRERLYYLQERSRAGGYTTNRLGKNPMAKKKGKPKGSRTGPYKPRVPKPEAHQRNGFLFIDKPKPVAELVGEVYG